MIDRLAIEARRLGQMGGLERGEKEDEVEIQDARLPHRVEPGQSYEARIC